MTDIRNTLDSLATALEAIANAPAPKPHIADRSLSGNKITGGKISQFSSVGIKDNATYAESQVLFIENDRIVVPAIQSPVIKNALTVEGSLTVQGEITATRLHVNEISADVRNERTTPLEFQAENGSVANKGLIWTGQNNTKQLTMQLNPDRLFSSETIDISRDAEYKIGNQTVLSADSLGLGIVNSNLRSVGTLRSLAVDGAFTVDNFMHYDPNSMRLGLGTLEPNGAMSIKSLEHEFIVDYTDDLRFKLGTWTTSGFDIVTDDTNRLSFSPTGDITVHSKTVFDNKVGIGVKNFGTDVDLTVAGPIRFQNKKQEVGSAEPQNGAYRKGDIVWSDNPQPTGYVGWICTREGTPGTWKPFGQISR